MTSSKASLRRLIKSSTGQDISRCQGCLDCDTGSTEDQDLPLGSLIQMALKDDDEVLHSRTLWSESIIRSAMGVCHLGLDLPEVITALRREANNRGIFSSL